MNKKIRFVTLFPNCPNVGLVKDVGQIPYTLEKYEDIEATLVSSKVVINGDNIEDVQGLKIEKTPMIMKNEVLTGIWYLVKHSSKIDWLNVYHCRRMSYVWSKLYKFLNPKGKVYLKLDMDFNGCRQLENDTKKRIQFAKIIENMDLVTVESEAIRARLVKYVDKDLKLLCNGFCALEVSDEEQVQRENVFLTVGRLGTKQKATEILLEAFAQSATEHNWKLKLIGSVESEFKTTIDFFYDKNPYLKERVFFMGEINDREKLYNEYLKSKVFVLPSRWESFGLVGAEALANGCRLILTNQVPPWQELTNNGQFGDAVPADDIDSLAKAMVEATKKNYFPQKLDEIREYALNRFSWDNICRNLYDMLKAVE